MEQRDPGHGRGLSWAAFVAARGEEGRTTTTTAATGGAPPKVVRIDCRRRGGSDNLPLDQLGFRDVYVLEHVVDDTFAATWFTKLLRESGHQQVNYWHQRCFFEGSCSVASALRRIHLASDHRSAVMMMDENVIQRANLMEDLQSRLPGALQPEADLFQRWPASMQPAKQCLVMGGAGGCSTLHTDMLGWTGWNLLLAGSKHWKFFPPVEEVGEAFDAEVREMGGQFHLGFSCTSPIDMYHTVNGEPCPERVPDPRCGRPSFAPDARRYPAAAGVEPLIEVMQGPNELIIFPAHYFHQTYHYEPTIAIACQMLNKGCLDRVLNQILNFRCGGHASLPLGFWGRPEEEQMKFVLGLVADKLWPGRGHSYLEQMWNGKRLQTYAQLTFLQEEDDEEVLEWIDEEPAAPPSAQPLSRLALRLALGSVEVPPWEADGGLPVAWSLPLAGLVK
mmetsp:Transcript_26689/g.88649  ORF Transcript_26689/g.88649 Transcript_26689/m.88649 type:complete len:448 (+) Transcript_26689:155-1498(+)